MGAMFTILDGLEAYRVISDADGAVYATDDKVDAYKWCAILKAKGFTFRLECYADVKREDRPNWAGVES